GGRGASRRVVEPLAPGARVGQGLVEAGMAQREDVVRGRDPRAAVADDVLALRVGEERVEAPAKGFPGLEEAALVEVLARRGAAGAGDVPGDRVDRLDLAAKTRRIARIEQHLRTR